MQNPTKTTASYYEFLIIAILLSFEHLATLMKPDSTTQKEISGNNCDKKNSFLAISEILTFKK